MRIVIGVIVIIISFILIAAAMWEFFNTEDEEMNEEKYGDSYGEQFRKLEEENAELEEHNKKLQRACYKWFMRWRREKIEVIRVSNMAGFKCNQELMQKTKEAKEIISEWLRLDNSNTKKTIIKKSENFLKE